MVHGGATGGAGGEEGRGGSAAREKLAKRAKRIKERLGKDRIAKLKEKADRRGIVYMSRIPPHCKPHKIRRLLEPHGEIGRIYLAPEEEHKRQRRLKSNKTTAGKLFSEGWVEFEDKREAKAAAALLNGQPMGGKSLSKHRYDLWNLRYLPKFKWDHLTEELSYMARVREQRLAREVSLGKKDRDFYLQQVDKAKMVAAMEERRERRAGDNSKGAGAADAGAGAAARPAVAERHFGQRRAKEDEVERGGKGARVSKNLLQMLSGKD
ncbi:unnamed protein product [Pedinophyceae sp. YPF-701]|nr:unnamed protein product [Pedinophyceae sp. YPF-701]